jgi:hypothetical protein
MLSLIINQSTYSLTRRRIYLNQLISMNLHIFIQITYLDVIIVVIFMHFKVII